MANSKYLKIIILLLGLFFFSFHPAWAEQKVIRLGHVNWPGVTVKNHVVQQVLQALGYEVIIDEHAGEKSKVKEPLGEGTDTRNSKLQLPETYKKLAEGNLDVFLEAWLPAQGILLSPYEQKGSIEKLAVNLRGTEYRNVVPVYVWEAGVHSLADLDRAEFRGKFDLNEDGRPELYGIEPGNEGNKFMLEAIANDTYGLGDWDMLPSSAQGMLAEAQKAIQKKKWIVFLGWKPHWMNLVWELRYLDDPQGIWPKSGEEVVWTLAREGFSKDAPNLERFFKQFEVEPVWQSRWILEYSYHDNAPGDIARWWIKEHLNSVEKWLMDVKSLDGREAVQVLKDAFGK